MRQCSRLEVRELRAEFIVQEAYYERKGFEGTWVELQDSSGYPVCSRYDVCEPFSNRTQAIRLA